MTTLDLKEKSFYNSFQDAWWNPSGPFKQLHLMNGLRLEYTKDILSQEKKCVVDASPLHPLKELKGLDVGCGAGIATEPLARMGTSMHGIDTSNKAIDVAQKRAKDQDLSIAYTCTTIEDFKPEILVDYIVAFEVLEHVRDVPLFCSHIVRLLKPGGVFIFSTLNRTFASYVGAIVLAEYCFRLLPRHTHCWDHFIKPSEIGREMRYVGLQLKDVQGMRPHIGTWVYQRSLAINYLGYALII